MKFRIIFATLTIVLFLSIIPAVNAFSIGISPAEKSIEVNENQQTVVYFIVSQGVSTERQTIAMTSDVDWTTIEPESFELEEFEQKEVKVTIDPLPEGNYSAKITASASIPGMKVTMLAKLYVLSLIPSEIETARKEAAENAINMARDMITQAREAGGNPVNAETMLTNSLEEFEKENYVYSKELAEVAYNLALDEYNRAVEAGKSIFLFPIEAGLIFILIWACIGLILTIYEVIKAVKKKMPKPVKPIKDHVCPKCGKPMGRSFDGFVIQRHICTHCGYKDLKTK